MHTDQRLTNLRVFEIVIDGYPLKVLDFDPQSFKVFQINLALESLFRVWSHINSKLLRLGLEMEMSSTCH